jgi:hypothetical protein
VNINEEKKRLREEITRLKMRLAEIDETVEPTSQVCGHDVVLDHLKKLSEEHNLEGLCQLAGSHNQYGWYTTNIEPSKIRPLLESGDTVRNFLEVFTLADAWETLESAYHKDVLVDENPIVLKLMASGIINEKHELTNKGFTCYGVLGHLAFNMNKKLEIEKAIEIFKEVYEVTHIEFGEKSNYDEESFLILLRESNGYERLNKKGISNADLVKYLNQTNV